MKILEVKPRAKSVYGKRTRNAGYKPGSHWVDCDRCGFTIRSEDARVTWDGLVVCPSDWEPRHPQDFVRAMDERNAAFRGEIEPVYLTSGRPACIVDIAIVDVSLIGDEGEGYAPTSTIPSGTFDNSL